MKNNDFQELVDQNLSGLVWDERKRQSVLFAVSEEEKPVKKISTTFILIAAIVCLSVTALAAGLVLSRKVDDMSVARRELEKAYGVTSTMLGSYFGETVEHKDNETIITFWGNEGLRYVLGEYTVTVQNGKASAKWSHDGDDTSGGFEAEAWGVDQLNAMLEWEKENHNVTGYLPKAKEIAGLHNEEIATNSLSEEEKAAELSAIMALADNEEEQARSAAKLSEKEMIELARQAIITVYGLTDEQMKLIKCSLDYDSNEEFNTYMIQDGKPVYNVWFYLQQAPADDDPDTYTPFTEKDGAYWVDVNVETGEIESTTYDTGLGGNG